MESRPVSFELYSTVAFKSGSFSSLPVYIRTLGSQRFRLAALAHPWRTGWIMVAFVLATIYTTAMPTLFSAMTGYAAISRPIVNIPIFQNESSESVAMSPGCRDGMGCQSIPCGGPGDYQEEDTWAGNGFDQLWAVCYDCYRVAETGMAGLIQDSESSGTPYNINPRQVIAVGAMPNVPYYIPENECRANPVYHCESSTFRPKALNIMDDKC